MPLPADNSTVTATFYLRLKGKRSSYTKEINSVTADSVTKTKPSYLGNDTIAVRLTVRLPKAAFEAFSPDVIIDIPAELITNGPIEVEAVAPDVDNSDDDVR